MDLWLDTQSSGRRSKFENPEVMRVARKIFTFSSQKSILNKLRGKVDSAFIACNALKN